MGSYQSLKRIIFFLLAIYFVLGLSSYILTPGNKKSAVPFFHWFLYITVPKQSEMYAIRIYEYHGKKFNPPFFFHESRIITDEASSVKARELIQRLGISITKGYKNQTKCLQRLFEDAYLPPPAKYEVVKIKFDPINLLNNKVIRVDQLKKFSSY